MKIVLLPSAVGCATAAQNLTSFLVNDTVALDAGSIGFMLPLEQQLRIRHVLLTHSHIDHVASLPIFLENVFAVNPDPVIVHAHPDTIESLQRDVFNDRLYPTQAKLNHTDPRFLRFSEVKAGSTLELEGLRFTPFEVSHTAPTFGYRIESDEGTALLITDTAPCEVIQDVVKGSRDLKAIFLEVAFPNELQWLADVSYHMTPSQFLAEVSKFPDEARDVPVYAIHIKPRYAEQIRTELLAGGLPQVHTIEPGREYRI